MSTIIPTKDLYDMQSSLYVLSSLMHNPILLEDNGFTIVKTDFHPRQLHEIVFCAIYNLEQNGVNTITPIDIDSHIKQFDAQYAFYQKNGGFTWLNSCYDLIKNDNVFDKAKFKIYYDRVKKFSVLRDLEAKGINTSKYYDPNKDALNKDQEDEKLNRTPIAEILNDVREEVAEIEDIHIGKDNRTSQEINVGIRELYESLKKTPEIGLPLDGDIINFAVRGAREGKMYIYSAPTGMGKALPNDTLIPVYDGGFKKVGDIKEGDLLIDRRGLPTKVLKIFPQGKKDVYRITFKDGRTALCNDEHLWTVRDDDNDKMMTLTLREIIEKVNNDKNRYHFSVPLNDPIRYKKKQLPMDPYTLGLSLAKGKEKRIPSKFLYSSIGQRRELLHGLLSNTNKNEQFTFSSTNSILLNQVKQLFWSLGISCITTPSAVVFEINKDNGYNPIVLIEKMGYSTEMTCFLVDNDEHLFLMNDFIVTHNTRYMVDQACAISMPYLDEDGNIVCRTDYQKVLFVATEMQAEEIQTLVMAHVSGINESHITLGQYAPGEEERMEKALAIIEQYHENFIVDCIPDPSIATLKARLAKYILHDGVRYIFYDYIFSSPGLLSEFRDVAVREDVALMMLSNTLKEIAMTYGVFVQTATQLNDGWSKKEIGIRDQNMIRGSKAIIDKADCGIIGVKLFEDSPEWKQIEALWSKMKYKEEFKGVSKPNMVLDIYKNRRGSINSVKVFRYFDFGTCRCKDLFITDSNYRMLDQEVQKITYETHRYTSLDLMLQGEKR